MLLRAKTHSGLPRPPDAGGETQHGLSGTAAEGSKPADTLSSDFQPPRPRDNTLLLLEPPVCGTSVQWPQQTTHSVQAGLRLRICDMGLTDDREQLTFLESSSRHSL